MIKGYGQCRPFRDIKEFLWSCLRQEVVIDIKHKSFLMSVSAIKTSIYLWIWVPNLACKYPGIPSCTNSLLLFFALKCSVYAWKYWEWNREYLMFLSVHPYFACISNKWEILENRDSEWGVQYAAGRRLNKTWKLSRVLQVLPSGPNLFTVIIHVLVQVNFFPILTSISNAVLFTTLSILEEKKKKWEPHPPVLLADPGCEGSKLLEVHPFREKRPEFCFLAWGGAGQGLFPI